MAAVLGMTTATGLLALLDEPEVALQEHSLKKLNEVVDVFWPEIADYLQRLYAPLLGSLFRSSFHSRS